MFGLFSKNMTEASGHYIDWSRVGNLIGQHRYTRQEILTRGSIIALTALSGILAGYYREGDDSKASAVFLGALAGFLLSHTIVIVPLIKKRCELSRACQKLTREIQADIADKCPLLQMKVQTVICEIISLSLSDDKHSKASQTWGHRKNLLLMVKEKLQGDTSFWQDDVLTIINKLSVEKNQIKMKV